MIIKLLTKYSDDDFLDLSKSFNNIDDIKASFKNNPFIKYIVLYDKHFIGYLCFNVLYENVDIVNIEVLEEYRNRGYASVLMQFLIDYCKKNAIINITLEVNEENVNAIKLYQKFNFNRVAIRKGYYNGIDGILMERKMM